MEYVFTLQQPCHNATIIKKDYKGLNLMVVYHEILHMLEDNHEKKSSSLKFSISF